MMDAAVKTQYYHADAVRISLKDVGRYMGIGHTPPDTQTAQCMQQALALLKETVKYSVCYMQVPVSFTEAGTDFGVFQAQGKSLSKNLAGCGHAILFAATTGMAAERSRKRAAVLSPSLGLALDAAGTAAIESFCDLLCEEWARAYPEMLFRPRFSPGYGDLPLETQKPLLETLAAGRHAGIALTDALLMVPQKSVSAIVGMGQTGCTAKKPDCCACGRQDCAFRL